MPDENAEIRNEIHPDIPAEFPGMHIERDDSNLEAAEAQKNCDLEEVPVAIGRKPEQQNDEMIKEADINDSEQVNLLNPNYQPGRLEPEIFNLLDNKEDHITGVGNNESLGEEEENANKVAQVLE